MSKEQLISVADLEEGHVFDLITGEGTETKKWEIKVEESRENPLCLISEVQKDGSLAHPYVGELLGSSPTEVQSSSINERLSHLARGVLIKGELITCLWLDDSRGEHGRGLGYIYSPIVEIYNP